ncbi:MAG: amidohydrolase family protein [Acidobacteriota bacterium]|nr:amidohydrolase family protein [Acidobacteriota bacterium]
MLIRDGRIEDVGPTRRIERLNGARSAIEIDATGSVVLPAFVDAVACPVLTHDGGDLREGGTRAFGSAKRIVLESQALRVLENMLRHGTATVEVQSGYGGDVAGEIRLLRIYRAIKEDPVCLIRSLLVTGELPDGFTGSVEQFVKLVVIPLVKVAAARKLARFVTVIGGDGQLGSTLVRECLEAAQRAKLATKLQALPGGGTEAAFLAMEYGATAVSHVENLSPAAVASLGRSRTMAVLSPGSTYHGEREQFAPARALIAAGAAVALATYFSREGSLNYSMPFAMSLACLRMGLTAAEAVAAATVNAAHAAGCESEVGSLEPGKRGDLALFDCRDYRDVVASAGVNLVKRMVRGGKVVYRRGVVGE